MDRLLREGNPPAGQLASPKPQYKKPGVDEYAPVEGQHGAPFATLKDASGNVVSPATEAKLEQVRALLSGVATENKLEQARVLLNTISTKDFATQTTLAAVLAKLGQLETEIQAVKANQLSGDQKVQLSGTAVTEVLLVNAMAIRDLTQRYVDVSEAWNLGTKRYLLFINSMDQPIRLEFSRAGARVRTLKSDGDSEATPYLWLPPSGTSPVLVNQDVWGPLQYPMGTDVRIYYRATEVPTEGSLTVELYVER